MYKILDKLKESARRWLLYRAGRRLEVESVWVALGLASPRYGSLRFGWLKPSIKHQGRSLSVSLSCCLAALRAGHLLLSWAHANDAPNLCCGSVTHLHDALISGNWNRYRDRERDRHRDRQTDSLLLHYGNCGQLLDLLRHLKSLKSLYMHESTFGLAKDLPEFRFQPLSLSLCFKSSP